jgi:hypothetical protein
MSHGVRKLGREDVWRGWGLPRWEIDWAGGHSRSIAWLEGEGDGCVQVLGGGEIWKSEGKAVVSGEK